MWPSLPRQSIPAERSFRYRSGKSEGSVEDQSNYKCLICIINVAMHDSARGSDTGHRCSARPFDTYDHEIGRC